MGPQRTDSSPAIALAAIFALGIFVGAEPRQTPSPTFRSETDYVELPVRVVDRRGHVVKGLTQLDFQVIEDGHPQTIATFDAIDIPIRNRNTAAGAEGAGGSDELNGIGETTQRFYLFVIDDLMLESDFTIKTRNLVGRFIRDHMSRDDAAAVILTSGAATQEFTQDPALLNSAVNRLIGHFDPATDQLFVNSWRHQVINTVWSASRWMGPLDRHQKALVLVTSSPMCAGTPEGSLDDDCELIRPILESARRSNTTIYTIDPRGLIPPRRETAAWSTSSPSPGTNPEGRPSIYGGAYNNVGDAATHWRNTSFGPTTGARILAEESGGFVVTRTNNFDDFFKRLVDENSSYYLIGYYSSNANSGRKVHKHEVKVARRGVRVFHRTGYSP